MSVPSFTNIKRYISSSVLRLTRSNLSAEEVKEIGRTDKREGNPPQVKRTPDGLMWIGIGKLDSIPADPQSWAYNYLAGYEETT